MYYLQSRYYDPEVGRFINADSAEYLGADGNITSYNLFAYCGNSPVIGFDPEGTWNWGGVIAGLGIIAGTAITIGTFGIGSVVGTLVAASAISTGFAISYAAATDSAMVVDLALSMQISPSFYGKIGISLIADFSENGGIYEYAHSGGGEGFSFGLSYSTGLVDKLNSPDDYSKHFADMNCGRFIGIDHCFDPTKPYCDATKATVVSFGIGKNIGVGYDYYSKPAILLNW